MRALLASVLLLTACGNGASLVTLQCRSTCQPRENPFRLQLQATYDDPSLALLGGTLVVRVDNTQQPEIPLAGKMPTGRSTGTIDFDVDVPLRELKDESTLTVGVRAKDKSGIVTDEITLDFTMKL